MKLTTAKTQRYGTLKAKMATGLTPAEQKEFEGLVTAMAKPEPRKKRRTAATKPATSKPKSAK